MPDMDGNELIDWLSEQGHSFPIVLISGYGDQYLPLAERLGLAKGANIVETLAKPFDVGALKEILADNLPAA